MDFFSCTRSRYSVQDSPTIKEGRAMTINDDAQEMTPAVAPPAALAAQSGLQHWDSSRVSARSSPHHAVLFRSVSPRSARAPAFSAPSKWSPNGVSHL
jgi:hypothetical protein